MERFVNFSHLCRPLCIQNIVVVYVTDLYELEQLLDDKLECSLHHLKIVLFLRMGFKTLEPRVCIFFAGGGELGPLPLTIQTCDPVLLESLSLLVELGSCHSVRCLLATAACWGLR